MKTIVKITVVAMIINLLSCIALMIISMDHSLNNGAAPSYLTQLCTGMANNKLIAIIMGIGALTGVWSIAVSVILLGNYSFLFTYIKEYDDFRDVCLEKEKELQKLIDKYNEKLKSE